MKTFKITIEIEHTDRTFEAPRQQFIDVNDLPDWQPLNPIAKRSNQALKKMYKGKAWDD